MGWKGAMMQNLTQDLMGLESAELGSMPGSVKAAK